MSDATHLLHEMRDGDPKAADELLKLLYEELRQIAGRLMEGERTGHTLQPTILVHDAWMRLAGSEARQQFPWANKQHFVRTAARVMRQFLIDHARKRNRQRRGGDHVHVSLDDVDTAANASDDTLLAVDAALKKLEQLDQAKAELVELHFFLEMSFPEAAGVLGFSESKAKRDWIFAKAWLCKELTH